MKANELKKQEVAALVKQLPLKLRRGVRTEVLACAVEEKVIAVREDGKLEWLLENKTLLAYYAGRMWCGDESRYNRRKKSCTWMQGTAEFPSRDLEALFAVVGLRDLRRQRKFRTPPEGFELIDNLFDTGEGGI